MKQYKANRHWKKSDISAYIDGELNTAQKTAFEEHAGSCVACTKEIQAMRNLQKTLKAMPRVSLPEQRKNAALQKILIQGRRNAVPSIGKKIHAFLRPVLAAAAMLIIAMTAYFLVFDSQAAEPAFETSLIEQETSDLINGYRDIADLYTEFVM